MNRRRISMLVALTAASAMVLGGCGAADDAGTANGKVSLTLSGWNLSSTPEFKTLADGFMESHPNVTIELKEYSTDDYDKQLTVDLSGGATTDIITIKSPAKYNTFTQSGGLADLSDVVGEAKDSIADPSLYEVDGKYYALPYRTDSWVVFYNKDMFKKAGVEEPKSGWTWDDYIKTAEQLKSGLAAAGYDASAVKPTYMHNWQTVVQAFALAQVKGADYFSGDYSYMEKYYERALKMQDEDLTINYATSSASKVQYQAQFGSQKAAMLPMGTWYISSLVDQQRSGAADKFEWGMVSAPQNPDEPLPSVPKTYGSTTGFSVAAKLSGAKLRAAKEFVKWACGEGGALALAGITSTPAYVSDKVVEKFFSNAGIPTDEQSKDAWSKHDTTPDTPLKAGTAEIQSLLNTMHSAIMTGTKSIDQGLADGAKEIRNSGALNAQ